MQIDLFGHIVGLPRYGGFFAFTCMAIGFGLIGSVFLDGMFFGLASWCLFQKQPA